MLAVTAALMPLLSFLGILLIPGKKDRVASLSIATIAISFLISVFLFIQIWNNGDIHQQATWFTIGKTTLTVGILLNNLSVLMLSLVTSIALLVHI